MGVERDGKKMKELILECRKLLEPLEEAAESLDGLTMLLRELGWSLEAEESEWSSIRGALAFIARIDDLLKSLDDLNNSQTDEEELASVEQMLQIITQILSELGDTVSSAQMPPLAPFNNSEFWINLGEDLFGFLVHRYFELYHSALAGVLEFFGIITSCMVEIDAPFLRRRVNLDRIPRLFYDAPGLLSEVYNFGGCQSGSEFKALAFLTRLGHLARGLGFQASLEAVSDGFADNYYSVASPYRDPVPGLTVNIFRFLFSDIGIGGIWLVGAPIPPANEPDAAPEGIVLFPVLEGAAEKKFQLTDSLELLLHGELESAGIVRLEVRPSGLSVSFDQNNLGLTIGAGVTLTYNDDVPTILIGSRDSSNLQIGGADLGVEINGPIDAPEVEASLDLHEGKLVIDAGKGDGFLQKILPSNGIEADFNFGVGWSTSEGLQFHGSGGLEATLPVHLSVLDVIKIDSIYLLLGLREEVVRVKVGLTGGIELGPFSATIERIGVQGALTFPEQGGNLGPVDLLIDFLPPTGAGFALDAQWVTGGGFLECDHENKRYSGVLALQLGKIGITAIGLITTRLPDGSDGFSMLVSICVTFEPPIQIYMGFTLVGLGGLIGVNRAMKTDVLREGLKKGTLDSILFPDPASVIANANQIISDMRSVFPAEEGRFVIGPMITLGWGTPTIIRGEIGVFISIPDPVSIALMGQVEMALPDPDVEIVGIHIDILGVLDMKKKELSFQASIYSSKLTTFKLEGDCAFFLRWGPSQEFALAIGGFHPSFTPPPPSIIFSGLKRLSVAIQYGPVVELQLAGYLALTPNSLQFGSRVGVFVGISEINAGINGFLSFDGLIVFSPFSFEVNLGGGVTVSIMGFNLADIKLSSTFSGPRPWTIRGTATVNVLFVNVNCDFGFTWGDQDPAIQEAVELWPRLKESLERPESWGSRLPAATSMVEILRPMEFQSVTSDNGGSPAQGPIIVHPASMFEVRQNVAPLDLTLDKVGNAPIKDYNRFRITEIKTKDDDSLGVRSIDEYFSRGQFVDLTNQQKLSFPSFEKLPGGVTSGASNRVEFAGGRSGNVVGYESILIKSDRTTQKAGNPAAARLDWSTRGRSLASGNASRRGALRSTGAAKFAVRSGGMVAAQAEKYVVVDAETLIPIELDPNVDVPVSGLTQTQAEQALSQQIALHPEQAGKCAVVAEFEAGQRERLHRSPLRMVEGIVALSDYGPVEPL